MPRKNYFASPTKNIFIHNQLSKILHQKEFLSFKTIISLETFNLKESVKRGLAKQTIYKAKKFMSGQPWKLQSSTQLWIQIETFYFMSPWKMTILVYFSAEEKKEFLFSKFFLNDWNRNHDSLMIQGRSFSLFTNFHKMEILSFFKRSKFSVQAR